MPKSIFFLTAIFLFIFSCKNVPDNYIQTKSDTPTQDYFHSATQTLVSAHRGGSGIQNYPENCLETLQYLHKQGITVFEVDVFQTKDKEIMLLHDNHLERTTTGNGSLNGKSAADLTKLNLVDDFGNVTSFKIPYFKEVLNWAKNAGVYLMIDFKDSAKYEDVIQMIRNQNMQSQCVLISYSVGQAKKQHSLAPEMLISVSARNMEELDWILELNIQNDKMIAFTGTKLSQPELYNKLDALEIPAILGTLGNLDRRAEARGDKMYKEWANLGIKIIATDRPLQAHKALK